MPKARIEHRAAHKKRMETIDQEVTDAAIDFLKRAKEQDKPFFLWSNSTRMHVWTRLKTESQARPASAAILTAWVEHAELPLDDLGFAENTIVMYSTDNGAEQFTWPDGGHHRSAARRTPTGRRLSVPCAVRLGRHDKAGARSTTRSSLTRTGYPRLCGGR